MARHSNIPDARDYAGLEENRQARPLNHRRNAQPPQPNLRPVQVDPSPVHVVQHPIPPRQEDDIVEMLKEHAMSIGSMIFIGIAAAFLLMRGCEKKEAPAPAYVDPSTYIASSSTTTGSLSSYSTSTATTPISFDQPNRIMNRDAKIGGYHLRQGQDFTVIGITNEGNIRVAFDINGREVMTVETRAVLEEVSK